MDFSFSTMTGTTIKISNMRIRPGTKIKMQTIQDIDVGATVTCVRRGSNCIVGQEYTITEVTPTKIKFEGTRQKGYMQPMDFMSCFERRMGPVVGESIRRGLCAIASCNGKDYIKGDIIMLTEAAGRRFDFTTKDKRRGAVEKQELLAAFMYV